MKLFTITMNTFNKETKPNEEVIIPRFLIVASKDDNPIKLSILFRNWLNVQ